MHFDWTIIINDLVLILGVIGSLFGINRRFPFITKLAEYLEHNAGTIASAVTTVEHVVGEVVKTPAGIAIQHSLHKEIDNVSAKFKDSEIAKLVLIGLHSFGMVVDNLSDTQKLALIKFITDSVPADWNITNKEIKDAIDIVEKASNDFKQLEIVKAANIFTKAQKSTTSTPV